MNPPNSSLLVVLALSSISTKQSILFCGREVVPYTLLINIFKTKVEVNRKLNTISICGNTKPFRSLNAEWSFIEKENYCEVTFYVEASFTSFIKEKLVAISFDKIALNIIDAFERRTLG